MGGQQFRETIEEIGRLDAKAIPTIGAEKDPARTVGLVFDFDQSWWYSILPQARRWDYPRLIKLWYGAMARLGLRVRVLRPEQDWPADLKLIVVPGLQMVDEAVVERMGCYARSGGHLVLTCRTGLMDRRGQLFEGPVGKPILPLIGGAADAYDGLPEETWGQVEMDGKKYEWGVWGDLLFSEPTTRVLATYADQFYAGAAAVMQNRLEQGIVTYCGVYGEEAFTDALAAKLAAQAGLSVAPLPARVQLLRRGPYRVMLNYSMGMVEAPAPPRTRFVVGTRKLEPGAVAVWKEAEA
jgi:beta-galactosidase